MNLDDKNVDVDSEQLTFGTIGFYINIVLILTLNE